MHDVVLPTLAVVLAWACAGAVAVGCGYVARIALVRAGSRGLAACDLWIGLAVLAAYLQLWSLAGGIGTLVWLPPAAAAAVAVFLLQRSRPRRVAWTLVPAGLGVLWLANRSLGRALDYDLGLYHLSAVQYALRFGTVPGLADLHTRLGAGDAQLLLVAFLARGPWGGAAPHLASGLLVSFLFVDVAWRRRGAFSRRLALLTVPAAVAVAGAGTEYRLSSPNLDLAAFVLVAAGMVYLAEWVESRAPEAALASVAALATAASTRPLYWLTVAIAAAVVARRRPAVLALPALVAAGWLARQAVLSGYPLFPTTAVALPVDWRTPAQLVDAQSRVADAWARWPGHGPAEVSASWHWLSVWLHTRAHDFDVMAPLTLAAAVVPGALARGRGRVVPLVAVVLPSLAAIVVWLLVAPDPRFVFAPLWLVPAALAAWAAPPGRPSPAAVATGALAAAGLAVVALHGMQWLVLAAVDAWALAAIAARALGRSRFFAHAALVSVALVPFGVVADRGAFDVVRARAGGTLGTQPEPVAGLVAVTTSSGLQLFRPAGGDQCWAALLCTPAPNAELRLRGGAVSAGFSLRPR